MCEDVSPGSRISGTGFLCTSNTEMCLRRPTGCLGGIGQCCGGRRSVLTNHITALQSPHVLANHITALQSPQNVIWSHMPQAPRMPEKDEDRQSATTVRTGNGRGDEDGAERHDGENW